jgi:endoglucanase
MTTPHNKRFRLALLGLGVLAASYGSTASAACSYVITNEWNTGATGEIRITNSTSAAINGWSVNWQYASANRLSGFWNATVSGSNPYTATNLSWNGSLQPGATATFGFQMNKNGAAAEIPVLSGVLCESPPPQSSSSSVQPSSRSSSSASSIQACIQQCNWYGSLQPVCVTTTSGWGYENGKSCVSRTTCTSQPAPYGLTNCGGSSSVGTSSSVPSSRSSSSVTTSTSRTSSSVVTSTSRSSSSVTTSTSRSSSSVVTSPSSSSRSAVSSSVSSVAPGKFRVNAQGNLTKDDVMFPARCGNWFGLEGRHEPSNDSANPSGAPMEMYAGNMWWVNDSKGSGRTIDQTMKELKAAGITMLRLPISPQTLDANDPQGKEPNLKNHQSIRQTNARQGMEDFIKIADANDIQIFVDIHSCSNYIGWRAGRIDARPPYVDKDRVGYDFKREEYSCATTGNPASVTKIHAYDKTKWLATIKEVAGLSAKLGVDNLIGIDIFNEPWDYTWAEWKGLSEEAFAAIDSVNPNMLIIVEGISGTANNQDGTPDTKVEVPHGSKDTNPNWGENLFEAGTNPINIPKDRLVFSPHTYGPSVFVQKQFMDPAQTECAGLEGDEAAMHKCRVVINPTVLEAGWEEHFGYLRQQGYGILIGEFGGNMDWPNKTSQADRTAWSHITTNVDQQWQTAAAAYFKKKGINACYWSMNPESADTFGWYLTPWDPVSANDKWGQWTTLDPRKTTLLNNLWGN